MQQAEIGKVQAIWRYPVKSMRGEELSTVEVTPRGLLGDRALALIDVETGKVASAKHPRRWPNLFDFQASFVTPPASAASLSAVRITLPDGVSVAGNEADADAKLSAAAGRRIRLSHSAPAGASAEGYWPDHDWLSQRDEVFEFPLPEGTFFDGALVHLLTTSTLRRLGQLAPDSRFDVARFRPNIVLDTAGDGFPENDWPGRTLVVGGAELRIDGPCPRCIMTTLPQGGLPKDPAVLKTAVQNNSGNVGVYATVVKPGRVSRGDKAVWK